jgi:hypothetical protein
MFAKLISRCLSGSYTDLRRRPDKQTKIENDLILRRKLNCKRLEGRF